MCLDNRPDNGEPEPKTCGILIHARSRFEQPLGRAVWKTDSSVRYFNRYAASTQHASAADAEDMLQETFISGLCIHELDSARNTRHHYIGPWLPQPILTADSGDPLAQYELYESMFDYH
jgi:hypothetical protein